MCSRCGIDKPVTDFHKDGSRSDGFAKWCKTCVSEKGKKRYTEDREKTLARQAAYRAANPERVRAIARASNARRKEYRDAYNKARYRKNREVILEKSRLGHMRRKYGVTIDQFEAMLAEQGGVCAICHAESSAWHIDHDHGCCPGKRTCGECLRGILCRNCNIGLGYFRDDATLMERAVSYLREK